MSSRDYYSKNKNKIIAQHRSYREKNREKLREYRRKRKHHFNKIHKEYRERVKKKVFEHYGLKCACCGESNPKFLTLDHINGGGTKERKKNSNSVISMFLKIIKNNYPKDYQVLCWNCNLGRQHNKGICPHREI